jgi:hypothetical protein
LDGRIGYGRIELDGTRQIWSCPSDTGNGFSVGVVEDLGSELPAVLVGGNGSELKIEQSAIYGLSLSDEIALRELVGDEELSERLVVRSHRHGGLVHRRGAGSTVGLGRGCYILRNNMWVTHGKGRG